jgi:hypothetical protein
VVEVLPQQLQYCLHIFLNFLFRGCHSIMSCPSVSMWNHSDLRKQHRDTQTGYDAMTALELQVK